MCVFHWPVQPAVSAAFLRPWPLSPAQGQGWRAGRLALVRGAGRCGLSGGPDAEAAPPLPPGAALSGDAFEGMASRETSSKTAGGEWEALLSPLGL